MFFLSYDIEMKAEKVEQKKEMVKKIYDEVESNLLDLIKERREMDEKLTTLSKYVNN